MKIITNYWAKPIPIRHFDWTAWIDGMEESGPYGNGETAELALSSLLESAELLWEGNNELCDDLSHAYCLLDQGTDPEDDD